MCMGVYKDRCKLCIPEWELQVFIDQLLSMLASDLWLLVY